MTPQEEENITLSVAQLIKQSEQALEAVNSLTNIVEGLEAAARQQEAKIAHLEEILQRQGIYTERISTPSASIKGSSTQIPVVDEGGRVKWKITSSSTPATTRRQSNGGDDVLMAGVVGMAVGSSIADDTSSSYDSGSSSDFGGGGFDGGF